MPYRRCIVCRRSAPQASLLRFAVADCSVTADPPARKPGRGAYLCGRSTCTDAALRRDGAVLRRALRTGEQVQVDGRAVRAACEAFQGRQAPKE